MEALTNKKKYTYGIYKELSNSDIADFIYEYWDEIKNIMEV